MMHFNFDEIIPRENTSCLKYDARVERFGKADVQPLWVADMDFRVPPCVSDVFHRIVNHGIYGYNIMSSRHTNTIIEWFSSRHGYAPHSENIFFTPGVVAALSYLIQCLTEKGDKIIVQSPVYYPFFLVVTHNHRQLVVNQLVEKENNYSIDFDDLEIKARDAKMLILCSPHNPVGRVWTKEELARIGEICLKHNVLILSDEIHNDLVFAPHKHIPIAGISEEIDQICITCHAPSKTFNLAGLSTAYFFVKNKELRTKIKSYLSNLHVDSLNPFGIEGMIEAYANGLPWLHELMEYLRKNHEHVKDYFSAELPMLKISPLEATYLLWIDFRALNFKDDELKDFVIEKAGLALNNGPVFGKGGSGFQRMNIACPKSELIKALDKLKFAIHP